ncbi:Bug family tripartite tricarboxylate transporter substrate binding protein [Pollutimonas harenae]|uniref:Tripartite tricarboxylate transporter substrate binding protein n=1 Tax=Pollutimonas harenae TaxID=657015 RepID=A0A853GT79_9BURK|nr:tripartite tricarboxylate transporter substrate binding protein [Pollutimonas harenae]NYT85421.1 tripartite tricarboxylate transporter substrate binding protein [Pollutimonas harenae]TEA70515.1 tripartite tricarboxylate transporter substrate binding protein [Pollutimonas harenae]
MSVLKKMVAVALVSLPMVMGATAANAEYPEKAIRWLVPYPAGGGSDFLARSIGDALAKQVGQSVVIENKPGGNTSIAANDVTRAEPDGYTVLSADNGTLVFNPALYKDLSYDPNKELAPVTLLGSFPMILVVNPDSGLNSVKDVIARARDQKNGMNYASAGAGSPHHLAMELFKAELDLNMVHVPYKGASPSLTDVAGGQVPIMMVDLAAGAGFIKGGKVKPLAVANPERLAQLPDVPTFAELGYPGIVAAAQVGLVTTAGTPKETIAALNKDVVAALNQPEVHQRLVDFGIQPVGNTPEEYAALLKSETERWHKLIKELGIRLD